MMKHIREMAPLCAHPSFDALVPYVPKMMPYLDDLAPHVPAMANKLDDLIPYMDYMMDHMDNLIPHLGKHFFFKTFFFI